MAEKDRKPGSGDRPETKPYAPPRHPDVNVPEQQYEGERKPNENKPR